MKMYTSRHFVERYEEIWAASNLGPLKPTIMNYSTMAMVWAEIVLQKDIDWRTVIGMNKETKMTCHSAVVSTNWCGESDCMSAWLNRDQFECPPWPMRDAEDSDDGDEEPAEDLLPPPLKRHEH